MLLPHLSRHTKQYVALIVAGTITYRLFNAILVPRQLRHLPKASTIGWFWSVLKGESADVRCDRLLMPQMQEHGLCLKYTMGRWTVAVGDPILLQAVLRDVATFPKEENVSLDPDLILTNNEPNVGNANHVEWKRQRRVTNPAFHRSMPVEKFARVVSSMFTALEGKTTVDFADYMKRYALDCLGLGVFNFDMESVSDPASVYALLYKEAFSIVRDPLVYLFPLYTAIPSRLIPYRNRARKANEKLRRVLLEITQQRREAILKGEGPKEDEQEDLLSMMIRASLPQQQRHDAAQPYLTNGELVANLSVFFVAGHETTASATASMLYYLAVNPDIQEKARAEVISVLGDAPMDVHPTLEQLRAMPYLNQCIKETMRINPPTSGNLPRICTKDTYIGQFFIPKGTPLSMELYCTHRLEQYWTDATTFNPDRALDTNWIPFGFGPRACLGMNFSMAEQRVVQAMMLRKYTWRLAADSEHIHGIKNAGGGGISLLGPETLNLEIIPRY
ncbi:cytochrome p450 [Lichtheimia corymbifera JMRC:FSU:9682]|uniref:Cytochrome p450 n=1 Tax=Lichtheimia corymbifera JMRC:FSU:9682 TaxID=1263082 RepID=A0A068SEB2_9FUNG|nr:cytochrome p450 [Lichtheimia corymbifera JMRC:FSU:9682]